MVAEEAGVADRATFETAGVTDYPGSDYDLVAFFEARFDPDREGSLEARSADEDEIAANPRAASVRLRAVERLRPSRSNSGIGAA